MNNPPADGRVILALGANQPSRSGAPRTTLEAALARLESVGVRVAALSRWRRSPAFPPGAGPDFVNAAALLETGVSPEALLSLLHEVERALGRERRRRWAPRVCDLDLIAHGDRIAPDAETLRALMALGPKAGEVPAPDELILPHPRLHERAFVLAPLLDIAPDWRHPLTGRNVTEMLAALPAAARDEVEVIA
ncbi:2-amino-4-hydroxy-6-hydroxymethyldihydropteridine diphosphokinase [Pikeienuella piscinae]|uniref:2-amino-4-hydroxy-6- hydroxymethyldihydropteridine diphosphokinase n=1 Tax=Pikeienuella piscinae TaxID=2748098 RepID=UPI001FEAE013|nr:2-amino-4-hydroxy-6-hydroxymethyldihydropteridine diphosphokinase [Pikeienuella piscinae]